MTKKALVLTSAVAAALAFHACTLPSSVEIKTEKLKLEIPTKTGSVNITNLLHHFLAETFNKNGIELYDMPKYTGAQAFVVGYTYSMTPDFDPEKILQDIQNQINQITNINPDAIEPINHDIVLPQLEWTKMEGNYPFAMDTLFESMKEEINDHSMPGITQPVTAPVLFPGVDLDPFTGLLNSSLSGVSGLKNIMAINWFKETPNFDSVAVANGIISLEISLKPTGEWTPEKQAQLVADLDLLEITIPDIELIESGGDGNSIGRPLPDGTPVVPQEVVLKAENDFFALIRYELAGADISIDSPPIFSIGIITATYTGPIKTDPTSFDFVIQPKLEGIKLRGAEGLRIGTLKPALPPEFTDIFNDTFDMGMMDGTDGLLNMKIRSGMLKMTTTTPEKPPPGDDDATYCEGFEMEYWLYIRQENTQYGNFPGLNGEEWKIPIIDGEGEFDVAGKTFNRNPLKIIAQGDPGVVDNYSYVTVSAATSAGISFKLYGDDLTNMTLPIKVSLDMSISELDVVRWKLETEGGGSMLPPIENIELDFGNISGGKNIANYIERISFEYINLDINFTDLPTAFQDRLEIFIDCDDLGFDGAPLTLRPGLNNIKSEDVTLSLRDENDAPKILIIEAGIRPVITGVPQPDVKYIEIGPLELNQNGDTKLKLAGEIDFDFKWSEVKVNLQKIMQDTDEDGIMGLLKGSFPGENEEPIDLYGYAKEYMYGFTLANVQTQVFLGGPKGLMDLLSPDLDMSLSYKKRINLNDPDDGDSANWKDTTEPIFSDKLTVYNAGGLPRLPGIKNGEYVYEESTLSSLGEGITLVNISTVISDMPNGLRFNYEMELPVEFTITPEMFELAEAELGEPNISVFFVMMIPLELQGMPGAYFSFPSDMFGDGAEQDLFGRKSTDGIHPDKDSIFTDINVKSLGLDISFDKALFKNGTLHLDKNKKLFPNGLNLGTGNSLKFAVNAKDYKIIRENMIYPDIKIEFKKGTTLAIPRNPMPTKITITANGSYTMDLPDFTADIKDAEDTDL